MELTFRRTEAKDTDRLMELFGKASATMALLGIDQWQDGYPSRELIEGDIAEGRSYVVLCGGKIIGTTVLLADGEPDYEKIYDGKWLTDGKGYLTIHRITVDPEARGTGAASAIFAYAKKVAKERGLGSVRVDTHRGNIPMRRSLEKNGFIHCGSIYLRANGRHRVAYEKVL